MTTSSLITHKGVQSAFGKEIAHNRVWGGLSGLNLMLGLLALGGCEAGQQPTSGLLVSTVAETGATNIKPEESRMWMTVGERRFTITLTNTPAARAFAAQLPLTLDMAELNGNEKHAELSKGLPASASRPGTIHYGDLMLYGSNTLVVFYETFDTSYAYTRLGRVDEPAGLAQTLGKRDVQIKFSKR